MSILHEAEGLLAEVAADPVGQVAVSVYDNGRLATLAPWLPGHEARLEYLCRRQNPDGGWGGPGGYAVVPTLSATAGLLAELRRGPRRHSDRLVRAATAGRRALYRWLDHGPGPIIPDTVASELVIPALLAEINALPSRPGPEAHRPLPLPDGFDHRLLDAARQRFAAGQLSPRAEYCLEVFGAEAAAAPCVRPVTGTVGCSPAATAAWVGGQRAGRSAAGGPAVAFLDALQARGGGPVPVVAPITYFEPAWVLNSLGTGGLTPPVPAEILDRLDAGLTGAGAPVAPGLPPDADDTGAVLVALARNGRVRRPDSLLGFRTDHGNFRCYLDERDPSLSANAHALEALANYLGKRPEAGARFAGPAAAAAGWLREQQLPDGSWWDKWHASPYYATACCVAALRRHGEPAVGTALRRAVAWVRDTQHPDGTWGRWGGTVEETSYAVQILALAGADPAAIGRGCAYLADPPPLTEHPPLWHGKDLYLPVRVVQAARLAALSLGRRAAGRDRGPARAGAPGRRSESW